MPGLNDNSGLPDLSQNDVLKMLDAWTKGEEPEEAVKPTAKGGSDEPESGESVAEDAQDEAETESDDKQEETEEPTNEEQPQRFRVKVDGADVEVTLDELTAGYSREADYTRKSQALAEERRNLEAARETALKADKDALAQEREQYKAVLGVWQKQLTDALGSETDWSELRTTNPGEWSAKMTERYAMLQRLQAVQAQQAEMTAKERAAQDENTRKHVAAQAKLLLDTIPEWKTPEKYKADMGNIREYGLKTLGFTDNDLASITDARIMRMAHDAARFNAMQQKKPEAQKKVEQAKPLTPGAAQPISTPSSKLNKLASEQARRGDKKSTVALFEALLSRG